MAIWAPLPHLTLHWVTQVPPSLGKAGTQGTASALGSCLLSPFLYFFQRGDEKKQSGPSPRQAFSWLCIAYGSFTTSEGEDRHERGMERQRERMKWQAHVLMAGTCPLFTAVQPHHCLFGAQRTVPSNTWIPAHKDDSSRAQSTQTKQPVSDLETAEVGSCLVNMQSGREVEDSFVKVLLSAPSWCTQE